MTIDDGYHAYLRSLQPAGRRAGAHDSRAPAPVPARATPTVTMLRGAMIVFRYQLRLLLREPVWIAIMMIQPLMYLALFGPLLERIAATQGSPPGGAWQVFVPGMLIQLGIFGSMFVGSGSIAEIRYGSVERMRVTPASRLGLLLGRVLRDTLVLLIQATLLTLIAVAFGLRVPASGATITAGIVGMLGIALSSLSYAAGLWLERQDARAPLLTMVAMPILLLSGILLPMSLAGAPAALRGERGDASLVVGLVASALLAIIGLVVATRTFQRESA